MFPITSEFFYSQLVWGTRAESFKVGSLWGGAAGLSKNYLGDPFKKNNMFGMIFYVFRSSKSNYALVFLKNCLVFKIKK